MKFLKSFLVSLCVLAAIYLGVGRLIDPRGNFKTDIFPRITMDARADKTRLFSAYQAKGSVTGLILGSSRSMKMKPQDFAAVAGGRVFNFSVNSARTEDMLAIYRWVRLQGARPRVIVVGLDVEALHDNVKFSSQLENHSALRKMLKEPLPKKSRLSRLKKSVTSYKDALTADFARDMGTSLRMRIAPNWHGVARFEHDGYIYYRDKDRALQDGTDELDMEISKSIAEYKQRFGEMKSLSVKRRAYLETLLDEAHRDGAQVIVWLTCLHPRTAEALRQSTRYAQLLEQSRSYLRDLQQSKHIIACDFSELQFFAGSLSDWYDGSHIAPRNAGLVGAALLAKLKADSRLPVRRAMPAKH